MTTWWGFFKNSTNINFISTSGGQSHAELAVIVPNELTWSFMSSLTGKKIIADSGKIQLYIFIAEFTNQKNIYLRLWSGWRLFK